MSGTPIAWAYYNMHRRCYDPSYKCAADYQGRGIKVCERWHDMQNFIDDMKDTWRPGLQLDRIDNDAGYSPENCRWTTPLVNARNRRNSRYIMHKGRAVPMREAAADMGILTATLYKRAYRNGLFVEQSAGLEK